MVIYRAIKILMTSKFLYSLLLSSVLLIASCKQNSGDLEMTTEKVHTFYYNWYGAPEHDKEYFHWNHDILPHWSDTTWNNAGGYAGGNDIGANFYPELGCYSSNDPKTIAEHFKLIRKAGIGVCVISWWGKNSFEDRSIPKYLTIAHKYGIKVAFHIEPFYKSVEELREQLEYIHAQYGNHPAIFKSNNKPLHYLYDSYKINGKEWSKLLKPEGSLSIRNTSLDATMIGLWVHANEGNFFVDSGFDGFYTYFASDGFVYGSTTSNWQHLSEFATQNDLIFIPSVGPGYDDTRIRPWNAQNLKKREEGVYYENMFKCAAELNPDYIAITSFNEWHEGTQIEPAITKTIPNFSYEDYGKEVTPMFYINKTKDLIDAYQKQTTTANKIHE